MGRIEDHNLPVLNERTYVKETAIALWENLAWVVLAGVLFSLVCLPALVTGLLGWAVPAILLGALTGGPGWAAMTALISKSILREQERSAFTFFKDFGHFYLRGMLLGVLVAAPLLAANTTLPLLLQPSPPTLVWVGLSADVAGLFLLSALYMYIYPQITIYDVSLNVALPNSFIMAVRYLWNTIGLLALAVLLGFLAAKLSLILLVILPAVWMVFVVNNCRMVIGFETGDTAQD